MALTRAGMCRGRDVARPFSGPRTRGRKPRATIPYTIVEFDVPVQVIAPAFGSVPQSDRDADRRRRVGALGHPQQTHARLSRCSAALAAVATDATGDDILPVLAAAMRHRQDVIEGQLTRWKDVTAVLATAIVSRVNVGARERDVIEAPLDLDVSQQANDRRELEAERNRTNLPIVDGDNLDLALAPERNRLLPVDDLQRLVRGVEKQRMLHDDASRPF